MLVGVTLLWGLSFPLMKNWQAAAEGCPGGVVLSSLTVIGVRMLLALAVLAVWQPRLFTAPTWREHVGGAALGTAFWAGFVLQVWGIASTTPALSAFFTSISSAWVPPLAWAFLGITVAPVTLLGLGVALAGMAVLGLDLDKAYGLGPGEFLTLLASVLFAVQILLLDRLGKRLQSAHLSAGFFGAAAILSVVGSFFLSARQGGVGEWLAWTAAMMQKPNVLRDVLLLTLLPTVLAFYWMNTYQPRVPAGRAALIYLLEPVFASTFSVIWGHDAVTARLLLGGGLILAGNVLVELPRWLRSPGPRMLKE
jgi:drug/metabolite transporter (DMT)-like permease